MNISIRAISIGIIVSVLLMCCKFIAYLITGSNIILTDAAESIVNVAAGVFAFYSVYLSSFPKDKNHPYGHGKIEFFAVGIEGVLIVIAGIIIIIKAVYSFIDPQAIRSIEIGTLIIAATGAVNYILARYLIITGKKVNSITLQADAKHIMSDVYGSLGVVTSLVLVKYTRLFLLDSLISVLVGLYIFFTGYKLVRKFVAGLMDETDFDLVNSLVNILNSEKRPSWIDAHNLRIQKYGSEIHIDCHLTVPYYLDLRQAHKEVEIFRKTVSGGLMRNSEFFVHTDPCEPQCCSYCKVENCPVRNMPFTKEATWTVDSITSNVKYFEYVKQ